MLDAAGRCVTSSTASFQRDVIVLMCNEISGAELRGRHIILTAASDCFQRLPRLSVRGVGECTSVSLSVGIARTVTPLSALSRFTRNRHHRSRRCRGCTCQWVK